MSYTEILKQKKEDSDLIKNKYKLLKKHKALWLIEINDKEILDDLIIWLSVLPSNFVVITKEKYDINYSNVVVLKSIETKVCFDFVVCDNCNDNLLEYMKSLIVPIVSKENHLNSILKEFQPIKNEGNSYLYDNIDKWSIYYAIVRYLENFKFSFDNKNLVKNLFEI